MSKVSKAFRLDGDVVERLDGVASKFGTSRTRALEMVVRCAVDSGFVSALAARAADGDSGFYPSPAQAEVYAKSDTPCDFCLWE